MNPTLLDAALLISTDITPFADIGTYAPTVEETAAGAVVKLVRNGEQTELQIAKSGAIIENYSDQSIKHSNFTALLASDRFGNIRDWLTKQRAYLDQEIAAAGSLLEVGGILDGTIGSVRIASVDDLIAEPQPLGSSKVLLIDGPAGIGKTQFIINMAYRRIANYSINRRPLILHVQSRGRTLSYLYDLIAFSLQRLRLEVTFDQVPILAKHGLVIIAIDGFDELADPDGYDLAWSQVNSLVEMLRGKGTLLLSGRETFIGKDRLIKDISTFRPGIDVITVLTLQPPSKGEALSWLSSQGWSSEQVNSIENYLEPTSLALRPFFLKTLSDPDIASRISKTSSTSVLSILMEAMIEREVGKFGDAVERELDASNRRSFLKAFAGEIARDMAENGTTAISDATLSWLVEASLPVEVSDSVLRILKSRSQVIAFLTNDDRRSYRRFYHEKFYEYFLSTSIIDIISKKQAGKVLAKSIFGSSFLETFGEVISASTPTDVVRKFLSNSIEILRDYPPVDRTRRNTAALAVASLAMADLVNNFIIASVDMDECRFASTASHATLNGTVINQLDCRGADISQVAFVDTIVLTLISDRDTLLPDDFPHPNKIQDINEGGKTITAPEDVEKWVAQHLRTPPIANDSLVPEGLRDDTAIKLLFKACRLRQYWLRRGDDVYATRILNDPNWPIIEAALAKNDLLTIETRNASGTDARFIHVRQPEDILSENKQNLHVVNMFKELIAGISH